jgi:hypothetical protein
MATSGVTDYTSNRNQIVDMAFYYINVYDVSDPIDAADRAYANRLLNMMIKSWQAQDLHLWKKKEAVLFLQYGQTTYELGSSGANATEDAVYAELGDDEASGSTTLTLDSTEDMTVGDYIGIQLDSGYLQWTTISTIPNSTTVTIPAPGLTGDATSGNVVYTYTTKIVRPLRVYGARRNSSGDLDTPMFLISHMDYFNLPNKTITGTPNSFCYDPLIPMGRLYVWPAPITVTDKIKFTYYEPIQIFNEATDDPDFPDEWVEPLAKQLGVQLSYRYGKRDSINSLKNDADQLLKQILSFDNEDASVFLQPQYL